MPVTQTRHTNVPIQLKVQRMSAAHRRRNSALQRELTQLSLAAPMVIATRTLRMWNGLLVPAAADNAEMRRMVSEKVDAARDGSIAMMAEFWRMQWQWWALCMQPWQWSKAMLDAPQRLSDTQAQLLARGLAPSRRRVNANVRRLRRKPLL